MNLEEAEKCLRAALAYMQPVGSEHVSLSMHPSFDEWHKAEAYIREALDALSKIPNP